MNLYHTDVYTCRGRFTDQEGNDWIISLSLNTMNLLKLVKKAVYMCIHRFLLNILIVVTHTLNIFDVVKLYRCAELVESSASPI